MRIIKRTSAIAAAFAVFLSLSILPAKVCFADGENRIFYCGDSSKNCKEVDGDGFAAFKLLFLKDVCGESAEFYNLDLNEFLNKYDAEIIFCEQLSDSVNYYCKANLPYEVTLYGQDINLHICVREEGVKVGSPIIFGGY